jgi:hypothetical protein
MTDQWLPYPVPVGSGRRIAFAVPRRRAPGTVRLAVVVMLLRAAISVGGLVVASLTTDSARARLADRFPSLTAAQINVATDIGLAVALIVGAAWVIGYAYLASRVRRGGNTARVLTIGWSWLGIAANFYLAGHTTSATLGTFALADMVLNVAIIVLLAVSESWDYSNRFRIA